MIKPKKSITTYDLLAAAAVVGALTSPALADFTLPNVPVKFRGAWISAEYKETMPTIIGAKSMDKCNIIKVVPTDDDGKSVEVTWKCPEYPNMLPAVAVWKLTKVNGQEVLMQINTECGACSGIMRRVKP